MSGAIPPLPQYAFMAWCLAKKKHRDAFTFTDNLKVLSLICRSGNLLDARFEVFTPMKIQVLILWVVTPCSGVVGYEHFRQPCCLHLQGEVKMEAA
jgi:hypothetical protein